MMHELCVFVCVSRRWRAGEEIGYLRYKNTMKSGALVVLALASLADAYVLPSRVVCPKQLRSSHIVCGWGPDPIWTPNLSLIHI